LPRYIVELVKEKIAQNELDEQLITDAYNRVLALKELRLGVQTSVPDEEIATTLPSEFKLGAYPNPFNPSTQIRFSLAVSSAVVLDVYSIDGTKVASLVNQVLNAGWHTATFNAANLPTGLYLYRLNTGNQQITKKMMLMK